jgi:hypothetical protein
MCKNLFLSAENIILFSGYKNPHLMKKYYFALFFAFCVLLISCTKIDNQPPQSLISDSTATIPSSSSNKNYRSLLNTVFENHDDDSIERPTVLGRNLQTRTWFQI